MDDGYIMAAMSSGPWINQETGYVPPGSYAAPQSYSSHQIPYNQSYSEEVLHDEAPSQGFKMVRGGRATDASPYTMTVPEGARGLQGRQQSYNTDDQSSIDLFQKDANSYNRPDLLSNSTYGQQSIAQTEAPQKRGLFGLLRKGRQSGNDSSDEEDEDEEPRRGRRWPFARRRRGDHDVEGGSELEEEDLGEPAPAGGSSFQVIRKPRAG